MAFGNVEVAGAVELIVLVVSTVETITVLDAIDACAVGAGVERLVRRPGDNVDMVTGWSADDVAKLSDVEVAGPIELVMFADTDDETTTALDTVDASVLGVGDEIVPREDTHVVDCPDVDTVVG